VSPRPKLRKRDDRIGNRTTVFHCDILRHHLREKLNIHFDTHGSVHRTLLGRNTNKMQLCNRIYYSKVFWRLNMFRAAHRPSSGVLICIFSHWFICPYGDRPLTRLINSITILVGISTELNIHLETTDRLSSKVAAKAFTLNISVQSAVNTSCHSRGTLYVVSSRTLYTFIHIMHCTWNPAAALTSVYSLPAGESDCTMRWWTKHEINNTMFEE
jgi:hypothetical protein